MKVERNTFFRYIANVCTKDRNKRDQSEAVAVRVLGTEQLRHVSGGTAASQSPVGKW
jgi:hypothetical protein